MMVLLRIAWKWGRVPLICAYVTAAACRAHTPVNLYEAARRNDGAGALQLIDRGSDVNALAQGGNAPLHIAAEFGNIDVMKVLLSHNANVNLRNARGHTPLWEAATRGEPDAVELLLRNGASVDDSALDGRSLADQTASLRSAGAGYERVYQLIAAASPHR